MQMWHRICKVEPGHLKGKVRETSEISNLFITKKKYIYILSLNKEQCEMKGIPVF